MLNKQILFSIIITNYNGRKWLHDCFESILCQRDSSFEIIVIDNASKDNSISFIKKNYPKIQVIKNKTNIGFGRANNQGVEKARGKMIFFLNNDTLMEKDTLKKLLVFKEKNKLNITGPRLLNFAGKNIHGKYKVTIDPTGYLGSGKKTFYIDGCALMISKKDFLNLGGFDKKYFMYSEDIDLCWRAHLYGMKIEICRDAKVRHFGGGTGGGTHYKIGRDYAVPLIRRYEVEKNNLRNLLKNYRFINLLWVVPLFILISLFESVIYFISGNFLASRVIWKAILWNLKNIRDTIGERKIIQNRRVVGDLFILSMMFRGLNKFLAFRTIGMPKFKE